MKPSLSPAQVRVIRAEYAANPPMWKKPDAKRVHRCRRGVAKRLARQLGVPVETVSAVRTGKLYAHIQPL